MRKYVLNRETYLKNNFKSSALHHNVRWRVTNQIRIKTNSLVVSKYNVFCVHCGKQKNKLENSSRKPKEASDSASEKLC